MHHGDMHKTEQPRYNFLFTCETVVPLQRLTHHLLPLDTPREIPDRDQKILLSMDFFGQCGNVIFRGNGEHKV